MKTLRLISWAGVWFLTALCGSGTTYGQYLKYLDMGSSSAFSEPVLAVDAIGNAFVASNVTEPSGMSQIRVTKIDPQGNTVATLDFGGSGEDTPTGAAVDPQGNLVLVGNTSSADFPAVSPLVAKTSTYSGFLVRLNSQLTQILLATRIGGTMAAGGSQGITFASAVAVDSSGNIYITGNTTESDFPVTPGAFQTQPPVAYGLSSYAFAMQVSPAGKIGYATYFGDSNTVCNGGSSCLFKYGYTAGTSIAVDSAGAVVIAGNTTASNLPITPGTFGQKCLCTNLASVGFVSKFGPGGSQLMFSTYLPEAQIGFGSISITSLILDGGGNVVVGGRAPYEFGATPGTVGQLFPLGNSSGLAGFVAKIDPTGAHKLFSTYLGASRPASAYYGVTSLALGPQGSIFVTGASDPSALPVQGNTPLLGDNYVANLSADGRSISGLWTAPKGAAGQSVAITKQNMVVALGNTGSLLTYPVRQVPSLVGVVSAAGYQTSGQVAPYELISLYGNGIGPSSPANGQVVNGVLSNNVGGTQVLFDGVAAPLLYAGPNQINAVVPGGVYGKVKTILKISNASGVAANTSLTIVPSQPQVFSIPQTTNAAALNQDGTTNSFDNPAAAGTIVTIWATGAGAYSYTPLDGQVSTGLLGRPKLPIAVLDNRNSGFNSVEVVYAGDAPELVVGTMQINFRLPAPALRTDPSPAILALQVGSALSPTFEIYVKP